MGLYLGLGLGHGGICTGVYQAGRGVTDSGGWAVGAEGCWVLVLRGRGVIYVSYVLFSTLAWAGTYMGQRGFSLGWQERGCKKGGVGIWLGAAEGLGGGVELAGGPG